MSAVRNVADFGQPTAGPVQASDFLDRHIERLHLIDRVHHRERADAVGDEVRRVFRPHDALAEPLVANFFQRREHFGARFRARDQFHQLHVARRIEEVRPGPVLLKILRAAFGDQVNRQARKCWK